MKYKTVCYAFMRRGLPHMPIFHKFPICEAQGDKVVICINDMHLAYFDYEEIDKIIVREEPCQTGN